MRGHHSCKRGRRESRRTSSFPFAEEPGADAEGDNKTERFHTLPGLRVRFQNGGCVVVPPTQKHYEDCVSKYIKNVESQVDAKIAAELLDLKNREELKKKKEAAPALGDLNTVLQSAQSFGRQLSVRSQADEDVAPALLRSVSGAMVEADKFKARDKKDEKKPTPFRRKGR